ncbi:TetR/AcrR family transcriptional regulator [Blastococcus brunescens]|uniref:TetR/AcrR family transcriptional regulator n=1 Tax=Blastococcus brunescens TaxID=1564165 RepID=A0ABZ1AVE9_9ACTN|nr:TetR/AcrR family transcriptional regulator [Blastococcus sp. BMG 8361]WRL62117.1 TetR/AcrR family transcriptional regulator [Blastococcus sp. BMG 8361]
MTELPAEPLSRRDRARADTVREIRATARKVLVDQGVDGLALRAVAREMGMTAPGLYRYFASREDLVEHVVADIYDELSDELEAVRDATEPASPPAQLLAVARAFRTWATTHHPEFGLLFGSAGSGCCPPARSTRAGPRGSPERASVGSSPNWSRGSTSSAASPCRPTTTSSRSCSSSCRRGARSSRSRCRWAWCTSSCPAGSGSTGWSAWRSSATCASRWTTPHRCSRPSCEP